MINYAIIKNMGVSCSTLLDKGENMKQVVLIMVDTQRQDMLSCYCPDSMKTPALDALAESGIKYNNAYTCQPVCGPARSAIFTGLYPHSNGMIANCMQLGANVKTAGEWLTPEGVECGFIGKWHLDGGDYFGYGVCPDGYNERYWYDMRNYLEEFSDKDRKKSRRYMSTRLDNPKEENTFAHRCVNRAIDFLGEYVDKDFFLTVSLDEPHDPSVCPRRFVKAISKSKYRLHMTPNVKCSLEDKPEQHKIWAKKYKLTSFKVVNASHRGFYACNLYCDYEIGRLCDKIKELGIEPMIIYTSDHGEMLMSHGMMGKGCAMYNEITRIPFIISGTSEMRADNTPVSHIDILPTVMAHLGKHIPPMLQGEPLQKITPDSDREVFIEFNRYEVDHDSFMGYQPIRCIVDKKYKLVINLLTSDELYDMEVDPYEMTNLKNSVGHVSIRNKLHDRLIDIMNTTRDVYRGYYWHCRPWRTDVKPSFSHTGYTRQLKEDNFVQLDYSTGLPMKSASRKK